MAIAAAWLTVVALGGLAAPSAWGQALAQDQSAIRAANVAANVAAAGTGGLGHVETEAHRKRLARETEQLDPTSDGWETEQFSMDVDAQLQVLGDAMFSESAWSPTAAADVFVPDGFTCSVLLPTARPVVYETGDLRVERVRSDGRFTDERSAERPLAELERLVEQVRTLREPHYKFKTFRVQLAADHAITRHYVAFSGLRDTGSQEQNATWRMEWTRAPGELPRVRRIVLEEFEQVTYTGRGPRLFADCTEAVCGSNPGYREHLSYGINYWQGRIEKILSMHYFGHNGLAIGDVNGDGLEDVYVCQAAGVPNKLFVQQPDGTAKDMASEWGVDVLNPSRGVLLIDADNDGDQDLILCTAFALLVFANQGDGRFELHDQIVEASGGYSLAAADYDNDGDLDLYVCVYYRKPGDARALAYPIPYHDANNGGRNLLLRNEWAERGQLRFVDVTVPTGMNADNERFSFAASWEDFDNDGDQDIYVSNDYGRNCLYRNYLSETGQATFDNVADAVGAEDTAFSMSASWGDVNADGAMDLYVGNMFSGAGNRVAFQDRFQQHAPGDIKAKLQRTARGNSLFLNRGDGQYDDVSMPAGTHQGRWAWGSLLTDVNNDGWLDVVVANGFVTGNRLDDL